MIRNLMLVIGLCISILPLLWIIVYDQGSVYGVPAVLTSALIIIAIGRADRLRAKKWNDWMFKCIGGYVLISGLRDYIAGQNQDVLYWGALFIISCYFVDLNLGVVIKKIELNHNDSN